MKKAEMKKYEIRYLEVDALNTICGRIDSLSKDCQSDINRCEHLGECADGEEPSEWEMEQALEYRFRMQAYETALTAIMKLMGA